MRLCRIGICLVGLALFFPTVSGAQPPPPEPVRLNMTVKDAEDATDDAWLGLYMQKQKVGWVHVVRKKMSADGKTFYRDEQTFQMKVVANGQKNEMRVDQSSDFELTPPYRLIRGKLVSLDAKLKTVITLEPKGKGYEATIVSGKEKSTLLLDNIDYTLADVLATEVWLRTNPPVKSSITTREFDLEDLKMDRSTTTYLATHVKMVGGVKLVYHDVSSFNHGKKVAAESKFDENGRLLSSSVGALLELRRESEEEAKKTSYSADLFLNGLAKVDKGFGGTKKLQGVVLEIALDDSTAFPDGPGQSTVKKGPGVYELRLGKKYGKVMKATEKEIKEALEETVGFPIKTPALQKLASEAIGDAKTDREKVARICDFVHHFIIPRYEGSIPKLHDLLERKTGDCKSYALLFTCLCRSVGIPARTLGGFVYMGDTELSFGGHAWNDVLIDGHWVPVDASINHVGPDALHISLGDDNESSGNLLKTFGKLNFKVVSAEHGK